MKDKDYLIDLVIDQIILDLSNEDQTAIIELLNNLNETDLKSFLKE